MKTEYLLLNEAINIGEELLKKGEYDEEGLMYWKCMQIGPDSKTVWMQNEGIYSGTSGIILFFIELYKITKNEKYLNAIWQSAKGLINYCHSNPTDYYAFFTGRMGVSFTLLKVADLTKDNSFLEEALNLAENCERFLTSGHQIDDLINGTSGTLLGLIHLHQKTQNNSLLPKIEKFVNHLLQNAHPGPTGLYWDRSNKNIRGLSGYSHGSSGVGYVFLELGKYFNKPAYYFIAQQAFLYENQFFDKKNNNWPDFRKGAFGPEKLQEHKKAYSNSNFSFFLEPSFMSAWCHGAPGIGLARLRAYELLKDATYLKDAENAIKRTCSTQKFITSYNVCHGEGGNAMLFLEAYKLFKDKKFLELAQEVALAGIRSKQKDGMYFSGFSINKDEEDTSLFIGNAGIGYFYLQILNPDQVPSIVRPDVPAEPPFATDFPILKATELELKKAMLSLVYPKTIELLNKETKETTLFSQRSSDDKALIKKFKEDMQAYLLKHENLQLQDLFDYELSKLQLDNSFESCSFLYIKNEVETGKNKHFLANCTNLNDVLAVPLFLASEVSIKKTKWDWTLENKNWLKNREIPGDICYTLLITTPEGVIENTITEFTFLILSEFLKPNTGENTFSHMLNNFEIHSEEDEATLKNAVSKQIIEALNSAILLQHA